MVQYKAFSKQGKIHAKNKRRQDQNLPTGIQALNGGPDFTYLMGKRQEQEEAARKKEEEEEEKKRATEQDKEQQEVEIKEGKFFCLPCQVSAVRRRTRS